MRALAAGRADSITRSGARYYIDGSVAEDPRGLSVTLALYGVAADSAGHAEDRAGWNEPGFLELAGA